ncbi:unnamed protein product [Arctia plantaginis]|uniref:Cytochrome b561 domain-containing protein n=1 Tax=Arctia plantaginis TaxID=874455 RepID=A0A8S1AMR5_ARCPL|nr:unnamed protein product [Arctia plantaginis]
MPGINLEKKSLKFAPVKILVIESRGEYYRTVGFAFGVGLTHMFIGATTMVTFMYSLNTGNVHAILCTLGYQLFSAEAILGLSYVNGWSAHLRLKHRVCAHIMLTICGISCAISGLVPPISSFGVASSYHGSTGHITLFFTLLTIITGPLGLHNFVNLRLIHMGFGLTAFSMSSIFANIPDSEGQEPKGGDALVTLMLQVFMGCGHHQDRVCSSAPLVEIKANVQIARSCYLLKTNKTVTKTNSYVTKAALCEISFTITRLQYVLAVQKETFGCQLT